MRLDVVAGVGGGWTAGFEALGSETLPVTLRVGSTGKTVVLGTSRSDCVDFVFSLKNERARRENCLVLPGSSSDRLGLLS